MIEKVWQEIEPYLPLIDRMLVGKTKQHTFKITRDNKGKKTTTFEVFQEGEAINEILAARPWYDDPSKFKYIEHAVSIAQTLAFTNSTSDAYSCYSMITAPIRNGHILPSPKGDGIRTCRNTGKQIYLYYKNNKKIPDVKKKDLCQCNGCKHDRAIRAQEISEYRKGLSEKKKRKKKDPMRYR